MAISPTSLSDVQRRKYDLEWFDFEGVKVSTASRLYRIKQRPNTMLSDKHILVHTLLISSTIVNKVSTCKYLGIFNVLIIRRIIPHS